MGPSILTTDILIVNTLQFSWLNVMLLLIPVAWALVSML